MQNDNGGKMKEKMLSGDLKNLKKCRTLAAMLLVFVMVITLTCTVACYTLNTWNKSTVALVRETENEKFIGIYNFSEYEEMADRKSTRLNSSHVRTSRMPSSA